MAVVISALRDASSRCSSAVRLPALSQQHAEHERKSETVAIGLIERVEALELAFAEPIQHGRCLLCGRCFGERAVDRRIAGQLGVRGSVRPDLPAMHRRQPASGRDTLSNRRRRSARPPPTASTQTGRGSAPRRSHRPAHGRRHAHACVPCSETCAATTFQPSAQRAQVWRCRPRAALPSRMHSACVVANS